MGRREQLFSSSVAEFVLEGAVLSCSVAVTGEAEVFTGVLSQGSSNSYAFADAVASRTILSIASSIAFSIVSVQFCRMNYSSLDTRMHTM